MAKRNASTAEAYSEAIAKFPKAGTSSQHEAETDPKKKKILKRLGSEFYEQGCEMVAKSLLGKVLVRKVKSAGEGDSEDLTARIVETEAYIGPEDKASHSYKGKRTKRNEAMFMSPGTSYVYNIYGMYQCFNVSSGEEGSAVLIRAAEPLEGMNTMELRRSQSRNKSPRKNPPTAMKKKDLCNGPSKLCQAMNITKILDQADLTSNSELYIADDGFSVGSDEITAKARIGIAYAEEWTEKPLRFFLDKNRYVSIK